MQNAQKLRKIRNANKESEFGYVFAVSGPGKLKQNSFKKNFCKLLRSLRCSSIFRENYVTLYFLL